MGDALPPGSAVLPVLRIRLIGREAELASARDLLLDEGVPLLTLTGPGGVGKTRLAQALAHDVAEHFADGVVWIDLAPVGDPALVVPAIAHSIGLRDSSERPAEEQLVGFLRQRVLLLVLDNFEHLLDAAPQLSTLLASCRQLTILVTSRSVLSLSGEHDLPVPPLTLPPSHEAVSREGVAASAAVRLFMARARAVRPNFSLTDANAADVAAICQRLDGLPLAIELAASRIAHFPLSVLLQRLEQRLPMLTGGARDLPARLRTMRDAIAWSYDLLRPNEQVLFRKLAVFVGGFTLDAAATVANDHQGPDVIDGVAALIDKSLVQTVNEAVGEPRYQMLETVREFGLDQLAARDEMAEVKQAQALHFLALAEDAAPALIGPRQGEWLRRLDAEHPNLRTALDWFRQRGETEVVLRLAAAVWYFWFIRGHNREGSSWLAQALAAPQAWSPALRDALHGASMLASNQADYRQADAYAEELLRIAREENDQEGVGRAQFLRSFAATYRGDRIQALELAEEAMAHFHRLGDPYWIGIGYNRLAIVCHAQGDFKRAEALYEEELALWQSRGDTWGFCFVTTNLGVAAQAQGKTPRAAACYRESLLRLQALGETWGVDEMLAPIAALAAESGLEEEAARLIGATDDRLEATGYVLPPFVHKFYEQAVASTRHALGAERFVAGRESGRRLTRTEVIGEAMQVVSAIVEAPSLSKPSAPAVGLTPRELEVLRLVAQGHSNREIAEALFISVPTVKRHLTTILGKLSVPSRSAATSYAHTHGLV
jgi:predicted ATPase/DNA-binding CsgD family transcriptional regulator